MIDVSKLNSIEVQKFVKVEDEQNTFILLNKLPVKGLEIKINPFSELSLLTLYNIECAGVFIGNVFKIPNNFIVSYQSNYITVADCYGIVYKGVKSIMSNDRFSIFTDKAEKSMLIVNNKEQVVKV